jgi:carboxyl-terminal processing protease
MEEKTAAVKTSFFDKKITIANVIVMLGVVLLLGLGLGASNDALRTYVYEKAVSVAPSGDLGKKDFSLYWEVYQQLQETYVDPTKLDADTLLNGSIKGMVEALEDDPTVYLDAKETAEYKKSQSGSYSGIGAELDYVNKAVVVVAPFDGSPAAKAGLEAKDIISKVDGKSTANKTLSEVVAEIRGEAGTKVKLTILRTRENYKEHTIEIVRGNVNAPSIELKTSENGIATVKISRFTESTLSEWVTKWNAAAEEVIKQYKSGMVNGLVIDLRNNPGGYFDAAVLLAGDFLPKGTVIAYQRERVGADKSFQTTTTPRLETMPVVVLVNGSSASASEIFAGAMQHYKRAKVIGEKTYGKGTAQIIQPISDGSSLHVTVSKWLLPDKSWLNPENTITPDIEVVLDYELRAKGEDNQMDAAVKELKK